MALPQRVIDTSAWIERLNCDGHFQGLPDVALLARAP